MGNIWLMLLLQVVLIALNAVFACAEIAVISMNDVKLEKMAAQGDKRAKRLVKLTSQPARFLSTIQVAITLSGFLGSAFAAENFSGVLVDWLIGLGVGIPRATLESVAVILITLILSYFTLVFGELVPKRVAQRKSEALALGVSGLINAIATVFKPIVWFLTVSTNAILRLLGIDPNEQDEEVSEEEIRMMVDVGSEKGTIDHQEKEFIQNVFEFDDLAAGEICTHRTDVEMFDLADGPADWEALMERTRHAFYPVCREDPDDIVGVIEARDYLLLKDRSRENVEKQVKPAYFVPDGVKADVLFKNMRTSANKFAIVLDEFGGFEGIITMNDLVSQLVGDLGDEAPDIVKLNDTTWRISGTALIDDVASELDVHIDEEDSDTLSGLIFSRLGAVPKDGAKFDIDIDRLHIVVTDVQEHRVISADVTIIPEAETAGDDEE